MHIFFPNPSKQADIICYHFDIKMISLISFNVNIMTNVILFAQKYLYVSGYS